MAKCRYCSNKRSQGTLGRCQARSADLLSPSDSGNVVSATSIPRKSSYQVEGVRYRFPLVTGPSVREQKWANGFEGVYGSVQRFAFPKDTDSS